MGFGQSDDLTSPFSVDDYAKWLKEKMERLGVHRPHVAAHSFGCRVAVRLASRDEEVFDKILLTGAAGVILNRSLGYHIKVRAYKLCKTVLPRFAEKKFGSAEYKTLTPIMKESYKKIVNEDLRACAALIRNEVLLVQGREDTTTPLKEAQAYLQCLKRGRLLEMDGGHFAFCQHPVAFNLIAEEFFYE